MAIEEVSNLISSGGHRRQARAGLWPAVAARSAARLTTHRRSPKDLLCDLCDLCAIRRDKRVSPQRLPWRREAEYRQPRTRASPTAQPGSAAAAAPRTTHIIRVLEYR